jgi:hypothetical protein
MTQRKPTIWEALAIRLGREPTNAEANADVRRILHEGHEADLIRRAERGALPHQRNHTSK